MGVLISDQDSLAQAVAKVMALESFTELLVRDCKFQEFMRQLLLVFLRVVKCEAGSILEVDQEDQRLFFRAVAGRSSDRVAQFVIPMGQGIAGRVAATKEPLIVSNIEECAEHMKSVQDAVGFETKNLVAFPILIRGRVFGVVELLNRLDQDSFSPDDIELIRHLCLHAARIIEARLMIAWSAQQNERRAA